MMMMIIHGHIWIGWWLMSITTLFVWWANIDFSAFSQSPQIEWWLWWKTPALLLWTMQAAISFAARPSEPNMYVCNSIIVISIIIIISFTYSYSHPDNRRCLIMNSIAVRPSLPTLTHHHHLLHRHHRHHHCNAIDTYLSQSNDIWFITKKNPSYNLL